MKQYEIDALIDHGNRFVRCTLDGKPARICGRLLDHGIVTDGDRDIGFSWYAIERILDDGGTFVS